MTQPYLTIRHHTVGGAQLAVFKELNRQLIQVGEDFGVGESYNRGFGTNPTPSTNRVVNWQNDLYAIAEQKIWKYDVANSGSWGVFYTPSSPAGPTSFAVGFTAASLDAEPILICGYSTSDDTGRFITVDATGLIKESADKTFRANTFLPGSEPTSVPAYAPVSWRNEILFVSKSSSGYTINSYNLSTEVLNVSAIQNPEAHSNICIFEDKPFCISNNNSSLITHSLYRIDGATPTDVGTIPGLTASFSNAIEVLVSVTGCLFAVVWHDESAITGWWTAEQLLMNSDGTLNSTINRDSILPAEIKSGGAGIDDRESHIYPRVDTITNNGREVPTYEFDVVLSQNEGATRSLYYWNGDMNTAWSFVNAGMDVGNFDYVVQTNGSCGERVWSGSGTLNASGPSLSVVGTNILAAFKVYGASQTGVSAELLYDKQGELTNSIGTLVSVDVGVVNGNVIEGLTADGATEVTVVWAASVDGISIGDNPKVAIRVFI